MTWEDEELEKFLKQFRLKVSGRTLPAVAARATYRFRAAAAAAAIVLILGVAAGIEFVRAPEASPTREVSTVPSIAEAQLPESPVLPRLPEPAVQMPTKSVTDSTATPVPEESGPDLRKLAPEPRRLTTTRVIPVEGEAVPLSSQATNTDRATSEQDAGQAIFRNACGTCHALSFAEEGRWNTLSETSEFINRKVASGAQVAPEDVPQLAVFLFFRYGQQAQQALPRTDPGKAVFDSACVQCHSADAMKNHVYPDAAEYQRIVTDMIGKGAIVTEAQVGPLVEYLMRTYGVKRP